LSLQAGPSGMSGSIRIVWDGPKG